TPPKLDSASQAVSIDTPTCSAAAIVASALATECCPVIFHCTSPLTTPCCRTLKCEPSADNCSAYSSDFSLASRLVRTTGVQQPCSSTSSILLSVIGAIIRPSLGMVRTK